VVSMKLLEVMTLDNVNWNSWSRTNQETKNRYICLCPPYTLEKFYQLFKIHKNICLVLMLYNG
jgi:hypothetical protein